MDIYNRMDGLASALKQMTIKRRRDFHTYPESGWTEYRTAAIVATTLADLGYQLYVGEDAVDEGERMGVPSPEVLLAAEKRAIAQGADERWVKKMQGGKTGIAAVLEFDKEGPVVALRFDMDANDVSEAEDIKHRPQSEGFSSKNSNVMHACGHDGHTAVGLAVAQLLAEIKEELKGTVKLIFQPAEEGVRGAKAMAAKGLVDDVDYMLGAHFGFKMNHTRQLACNVTGFLATTKYDAFFSGVPAHAGAAPEQGKNALLAAACAALNLHAISRHGEGASRINVGSIEAGSGRNVIGDKALIKLETRGASSRINHYMEEQALRIIHAAAQMYDVDVDIKQMGSAAGANNSQVLSTKIRAVAEKLEIFDDLVETADFGASEDFSYFMERVQERGGQAAYMMIGADLSAGHHDSYFDFDEAALDHATRLLSRIAVELLSEKNIG